MPFQNDSIVIWHNRFYGQFLSKKIASENKIALKN